MIKLVMGVGINDRKYPARANGKIFKEYEVWERLLSRCYCPISQKRQPTYIGCSVSENFKNYSYFYAWCQSQIGFDQEGYHLDKDLLVRGNKVYSEDSCVFLPQELNKMITSSGGRSSSGLPLGVSMQGNKFVARCRRGFALYYIGLFNTPEEAHNAYKQAKETYIKLQAEKWKDQIDVRAYEALMRYEVLPTD